MKHIFTFLKMEANNALSNKKEKKRLTEKLRSTAIFYNNKNKILTLENVKLREEIKELRRRTKEKARNQERKLLEAEINRQRIKDNKDRSLAEKERIRLTLNKEKTQKVADRDSSALVTIRIANQQLNRQYKNKKIEIACLVEKLTNQAEVIKRMQHDKEEAAKILVAHKMKLQSLVVEMTNFNSQLKNHW